MDDKLLEDVRAKQQQIETFLPVLHELKQKMRKKRAASKETISSKMQELHFLVDKWEERFIETANETLDEKIDILQNQEKTLKTLNKHYVVEKKPPPPLLKVHKRANSDRWRATRKKPPQPKEGENTNSEITPTTDRKEDEDEEDDGSDQDVASLDTSMSMETSMSFEEGEDVEFNEIRALLEGLAKIKFPLAATGVKLDEVDGDHQKEFAELLDEASKSLKRTLTFIGGIVRGYLRKGQKSDKWIAMIRRLESRFENDQPVEAILESAMSPQQPKLYVPAMTSAAKVWKVVSDFWKYIENAPLREEMIKVFNTVFKTYANEIEYYLVQLLNIIFSQKIKELEAFLLQKGRENHNFGLQIWFTAFALGYTQGSKKWTNRCKKFLKRLELALALEVELGSELDLMNTSILGENSRFRNGLEALPSNGTPADASGQSTPALAPAKQTDSQNGSLEKKDSTPDISATVSTPKPPLNVSVDGTEDKKDKAAGGTVFPPRAIRRAGYLILKLGKEYFFTQVEAMRELVDISGKLAQKFSQPETYKPEMRRLLDVIQERFVVPGTAYLPFTTEARHRILNINIDECFPIPTYGRVLYYLMVEVVPIPTNCSVEMAEEIIRSAAEIHKTLEEKPKKAREDDVDNAREDDEDDEKKSERSDTAMSGSEDLEVQKKTSGKSGVFGELWPLRRDKLRKLSPYGHLAGWDVRSFIVKNGDFVLQEQFVMQLLTQFQRIFEECGLPLHLRTYRIMALNHDCGFIEFMQNTISIDKLKARVPNFSTLADFYKREWPEKEAYNKARENFVNSLAAYSLVCYFLQIKDRHNGNIMLDSDGYLLHIDFGYLLARTIKFEKAPFKLTEEMIEVMGGEKSKLFKKYVELLVQGFLAIRNHYEKILMLVEMTLVRAEGEGQIIPCLDKDSVVKNLRKRFRLEWNEAQIRELVMNLVVEARDNWRTTIYDTYQRILNDIY